MQTSSALSSKIAYHELELQLAVTAGQRFLQRILLLDWGFVLVVVWVVFLYFACFIWVFFVSGLYFKVHDPIKFVTNLDFWRSKTYYSMKD